jgi:hypothetical protein
LHSIVVYIPLYIHIEQVFPGSIGKRAALQFGEIQALVGERLEAMGQRPVAMVDGEDEGRLGRESRIHVLCRSREEHEAGAVLTTIRDPMLDHVQSMASRSLWRTDHPHANVPGFPNGGRCGGSVIPGLRPHTHQRSHEALALLEGLGAGT